MKPSFLCLELFLIFCGSLTLVRSQDSCSEKVDPKLASFDTSSLRCVSVWPAHNFLLRYDDASPISTNFVLSFPADINSYVALGFSRDGQMVGSIAVVAWIESGQLQFKSYILNGKTTEKVTLDGEHSWKGPIDSSSTTAYISFVSQGKPPPYLIFAVGPKSSFPSAPNYVLQKHRDTTSLWIDYKTGKIFLVSSLMLRRSHGWLSIIGWSLLMMIGSIIARYCKQWDPLWFYLHSSLQTLGFVGGVVGIICGWVLSKKVYVTHHKNIGILILVLGCLQVMAFVLRPRKESSLLRKYWNYYHHNVGRILTIFALVNSFYGLSLGGEGSKWFAGYGGSVTFLVIVAIILEIRMRMKPKTQMPNQYKPEFSLNQYQ